MTPVVVDDGYDACSSSMSSEAPSLEKKVRFDRLEVFYHQYALGDNPSASEGAPLTIEWEHFDCKIYRVDYYEYESPSVFRRPKEDFRLTPLERIKM